MEDYRITKTRAYMFDVINTLTDNRKYQINADMLGKVDDFSLDKIPTESVTIKWITGVEIHRDVYSFRSKKAYSQDTINNLNNIGFFESLEEKIDFNNKNGILPDIKGIESIKCLNCGTMISSIDGKEAIFDIQIEVTYRKDKAEREVSL